MFIFLSFNIQIIVLFVLLFAFFNNFFLCFFFSFFIVSLLLKVKTIVLFFYEIGSGFDAICFKRVYSLITFGSTAADRCNRG